MLTNPTYLLALAGLAVPIAIHLLSRKEGKVIRLGSIRHVLETSTQQFKGIKLNEILLLSFRCAMVVVFSVLLSGLQCTGTGEKKWVLLEKGLERVPAVSSILDSLSGDYERRWLAKGFPLLNESPNEDVQYRALLEDLIKENLSEAIVFSKNSIANFAGLRTSLPEQVRWIGITPSPVEFSVGSFRTSSDSAVARVGSSNQNVTDLRWRVVDGMKNPEGLQATRKIEVQLVSGREFRFDGVIVKAALAAIEKNVPVKIQLSEPDEGALTSNADWCIWLSSKVPPVSLKNLIRFHPEDGVDLLVQTARNRWAITRRLKEGEALEEHFTPALASVLLRDWESHIDDRRAASDSLAWNKAVVDGGKGTAHVASADKFLILILAVLLLAERVIAFRKRQ